MSEENTKQKLYEQEERNARLWNMIHWLLSRCSDHERSLFNQDFAEPTTIKVLVPMPPVCAIYTDGEEKKKR